MDSFFAKQVADEEEVADGRNAEVVDKYGAPETIRTSDTRFRKANEDEESND